MKVICLSEAEKRKKLPWKETIKCQGDPILKTKGCRTVVEVSEKDLKLFHFFGTHFKHKYLCAKCPVCGKVLHALTLKVPTHIVRRWEEKHPNAQSEFDGMDER